MPYVETMTELASNVTLSELGARVRAWRARRGMTRKALASDSGLSERFLADVESGKGNVSINSLEAAARALNISILELLQDAPRPALARVQSLLGRLDDTQLDQAYGLLGSTFGLGDAQGRERRIALIGLRGAGKSTLGLKLAGARGVPFVELDREIEREAGTSMNEILLLHGQAGYRRYERRALFRIAEEHVSGVVMTTGGSIVSERETFDLLQSRFYCVWLKASPEEHMARVVAQGDMRPFDSTRGATQEAMEDLRRILASRESLYARADAVVDTSARTLKQSLKDMERAVPPTTVRAEPVEAPSSDHPALVEGQAQGERT
ncbi:MAG: helix-turn-helix transcriptional regulator [Polaromonas sp.]|uniref:helix-turn-helix transcriptional regulator n=2 Tax=Polaromonas sp. TaxID=1869339 RepID=UPI00272EEE56|nr:helix-turn-helix transcriptional regulator [Polaromonas sp.]MDP1739489.1 helix-turn-helix transcriptional regulator [Polaromonas sp.]MDP1956400.1 helix-turn-helix transcriptional regulator [Polaromonas sp.]MDP3750334.1 helix-turn-helix transcriptional regulator [Polaromonas sp.]